MKYNNFSTFLYYIASFFIYIFLFSPTQSIYSLAIFALILILLFKVFSKKLYDLENKLFFISSLFFYQRVHPINIRRSFSTIQMLILSQKVFAISILLSISLLIFFLIYQNKLNLSYVIPNPFIMHPIKLFKEKKQLYTTLYGHSRNALNRENIKYLFTEIPRHGYLRYTSKHNLSEDFFTTSEKAIQKDDRLYLILSQTGSPASEVISLFTQKDFNHLSLSFDRNLETMVSYNGGNDFQNPGLNTEDLNSLYQKEESQALVYSLQATKQQRLNILNNITIINQEGSAYNVLGLLTNYSIRPNMMFCSQFVYVMLENVGLNYVTSSNAQVIPTDFIEKDYSQLLRFEYEIDFSNLSCKKRTS